MKSSYPNRGENRPRARKKKAPSGCFEVWGQHIVEEYLKDRAEVVLRVLYDPGAQGARQTAEQWGDRWGISLEARTHLQERRSSHLRSLGAVVKLTIASEDSLVASLSQSSQPSGSVRPSTIVALDHITDPHNFGAILRSASFFGIRHLIIPKDRQVQLTQTVVDVSQGGLAHVQVYGVTNLSNALKILKKNGYWVAGADMGGEPYQSGLRGFEFCALVLGAEGKGLSALAKKHCDVIVTIESPASQRVQSLNVSVAAGLMFQARSADVG